LTDCETGPRRQRLNKKLKRGETETLKPEAEDDIIAAEIVEDLEAVLQQFAAIANDLKR